VTHRTFGAVRLSAQREPVTFDFGIYGEERFTVLPEPTLGDCFDLADAPDPTPTNEMEVARACARFIRRMIDPADHARFDTALHRIPASEAHIIYEAAAWIAEQVTAFPTSPPGSSSAGREHTGKPSKPRSAGRPRSRT